MNYIITTLCSRCTPLPPHIALPPFSLSLSFSREMASSGWKEKEGMETGPVSLMALKWVLAVTGMETATEESCFWWDVRKGGCENKRIYRMFMNYIDVIRWEVFYTYYGSDHKVVQLFSIVCHLTCLCTWAAWGSSPHAHCISGLAWLVSSESLFGVNDGDSSGLLRRNRAVFTLFTMHIYCFSPFEVHFDYLLFMKDGDEVDTQQETKTQRSSEDKRWIDRTVQGWTESL